MARNQTTASRSQMLLVIILQMCGLIFVALVIPTTSVEIEVMITQLNAKKAMGSSSLPINILKN